MAKRKRKSLNKPGGASKKAKVSDKYLTSLPNELIIEIMERMQLNDRMNLGRTCIRFHNVLNSYVTLRKDKVAKLTGRNMNQYVNLFKKRVTNNVMRSRISHFEFNSCNLQTLPKMQWTRLASTAISFNFSNCHEYFDLAGADDDFAIKLSKCKSLRELDVNPIINPNFLNHASELANLKLTSIKVGKLSDYAFNNFIRNSRRNLQELYPYEYDSGFQTAIVQKFETLSPEAETDQNDLTTGNIVRALQLSNISSLGDMQLKCEDMVKIFQLHKFGFQMEKLNLICDLTFFQDGNDTGLQHSCSHIFSNFQHRLEYLNIINGNPKGVDKLTKLRKLILPSEVSERTLQEMQALKTLKELQLGDEDEFNVYNLKGRGIRPPIYKYLKPIPYLRKLELYGPNLHNFHLYLKCPSSFGLETLIITHCTSVNIRSLMVALCRNHNLLTDFTYVPTESGLQEVTDSVICNGQIQERTKTLLARHCAGIGALKNLKRLKLLKCKITIAGITEQFKWKSLTELDLSNGHTITDGCLYSIASFCPSLTTLKLASCCGITDDSVEYLARTLKRLRIIDLSLTRVTELGIRQLIRSDCPLVECIHTAKLEPFVKKALKNKLWRIHPKVYRL